MTKTWQTFFKPQFILWRQWVPIVFGIYYFLFFYIFQPFKVDYFLTDTVQTTYHYAIFGLIVFFSLSCCVVILPNLFPKHFLPENFTFRRFCFLVAFGLALTSTLNYFNLSYFINLEGHALAFDNFLFKLVLPTIFFTTFPLIIFTLLLFDKLTEKENEKLSKQTQLEEVSLDDDAFENSIFEDKALQNNTLEGTPQYENALEPIIYRFGDTNNKKVFKIASQNLFYITSAQNYVEIHYRNREDKLSRLVLRNSLKAIEEELNLDMKTALIRCHKAFIINREKVIDFGGAIKTGHFILAEIEESIPISRNKYTELEQQFQYILDQKMEIGLPI
jgi:hypothetical protein